MTSGADSDDLEALRQEVERERKKLRALQEIGGLLGSTLDLNELLSLVVERISEVMEADRTTLYLLDDDSGELWSKVAQGETMQEIRLPVGSGLAGTVAKTGKSLNVKDAYQDVRFDAEWDRRTGYRTRSTLCVPMKNQHGRTLGVVQVLNKKTDGSEPTYFSAKDEALLSALAAQAAVGIENSKLFLSIVGKNIELLEAQKQLRRKIQELDVLFEIAQVSATAMELDELLQGVLARAMRAVDAEAASILIADEITGNLHFRAAVGGEAEQVKTLHIEAGHGICGWVAKHNKPQVVNDADADERHNREVSDEVGYHPSNVLCVPLRWTDGDRLGMGALELLNKAGGGEAFNDVDLKLATVIAGHISTAIEQARTRERREQEERLSALGQVLSSLLHDLRTPMTIISGYTRLLQKEADADERQAMAETILRQVATLNAMTKETLAFARGDRKLLVRKVYLYKFFDELVENLRHSLGEKIDVHLELGDRGVAHFDEGKIQRAAHNLARNAAEACADADKRGTLTIRVGREDDQLVIRFIDDGPGVPEAIRERLFDSFATHGKAEGTGLGLAIVRQVVEDHGGSVSVSSEPGHTEFILRLPQPANDVEPGESEAAE